MVFRDRKVMLDYLEDRVTKAFPGLKDVLEFQVCRDRKVNTVDLDCLDMRDSLEPREIVDWLDHLEFQDKVDLRDNRDCLEEMAFRD